MAQDINVLEKRFFRAGTLVIQQGATGDNAYVVESGKVEVFVTDDKGQVTVVAELGPEAMFGEMSAVSGGLRTASVRAVVDTMLISISAEEMKESLRKTGLYTRLMRMINDRMWNNNLKMLGRGPDAATQAPPVTLKDLALHVSPAENRESFFSRLKSALFG